MDGKSTEVVFWLSDWKMWLSDLQTKNPDNSKNNNSNKKQNKQTKKKKPSKLHIISSLINDRRLLREL